MSSFDQVFASHCFRFSHLGKKHAYVSRQTVSLSIHFKRGQLDYKCGAESTFIFCIVQSDVWISFHELL